MSFVLGFADRLIRLLDEDKFYAQIEQLDQTIKSWVARP
jgi:hypothetical protein